MKTADLCNYLEQITGSPVLLRDLPPGKSDKVPLYLRSAYGLLETSLFAQRFVFAVQKQSSEQTTPLQFAKHQTMLREALGAPVALVLERVATFVRNRLIQHGVAFVVPGHQLFLPFLALALKERGPSPTRVNKPSLSAASQALLLRHLQGSPTKGCSLKDLATQLGYSAMTLTNASQELESAGLCKVAREGRSRSLEFSLGEKSLWKRALPHLSSPVRARHWVRVSASVQLPVAGLSALERYTDIGDDPLPTFAVWQNEYRHRVETRELIVCESSDDATAAIESWTYAPSRIVATDTVDRLSLYLSLRGSADERVEKALKVLLEDVKW